jgi:hypothetical protein
MGASLNTDSNFQNQKKISLFGWGVTLYTLGVLAGAAIFYFEDRIRYHFVSNSTAIKYIGGTAPKRKYRHKF